MEVGLDVLSDVFYGKGDGVLSGKWHVYNNPEAFNLEVNLV